MATITWLLQTRLLFETESAQGFARLRPSFFSSEHWEANSVQDISSMSSVIETPGKKRRRGNRAIDSSAPTPVWDQPNLEQPAIDPAKLKKANANVGPTTEQRKRFANISYWAIGWLAFAHLVVLTAPFTFTWTGLIVMLGLHWLTGSLGICL